MIIREIHTTTYSDEAAAVISAALQAVGNRYVTNNSGNCRHTALNANVCKSPNGEILVNFDSSNISSYRLVSYVKNNSDVVARRWLAWQIKDVIKASADIWKRNNTKNATVLSQFAKADISVQEAYCVYDILMDRKNISRRYPEGVVEKLIGVENDPFLTEMEVKRRDEIKLITDEFAAKIKDNDWNSYTSALRERYNKETVKLAKKFRELSEATIAQLKVERAKKIEEVNATFDAMKCL